VTDSSERSDAWYEESPHGPIAAKLGLAALRAFDDLEQYPSYRGGTRRHWVASDHQSFRSTLDCAYLMNEEAQGSLDLRVAGVDTTDDDGLHLSDHFNGFHTALPFSEAERHWLIFTMFIDARGVSEERPADQVRLRGTTDYDAGRSREIRGRDLLDAWWAWRRDIFEFQEQGGIDYAREALRCIGQILVPRMPCSYSEPLRGDALVRQRQLRKIQREAGILTGRRRQTSS
jgi:hypothetical protein